NLADLKNLAGVQTPMTGGLSASLQLHGSQLNPVGQGTVAVSQATISDEPIQSANVTFQGTRDEEHARFALRMPAGAAQGALTYFPKRKAYDAQLQTTGFHIDQLHALEARNLQVSGVLNLNASGAGTFDNPGLQFTAQIPQLQLRNQTLTGVTLQANVADHV